jgi:hypothetical protein
MDWTTIDKEFIGSLRQPERVAFERYFDGAYPAWECVLTGIPRREAAHHITDQLVNTRHSAPTVHLVIGASGEGKTTLIKQVAVDIAGGAADWRVFWREPRSPLEPGKVAARPSDNVNNLFVADDGNEIVAECFDALSRLDGQPNVHFLLATADTEWIAARGDSPGWETLNLTFHRHRLRGLAIDGIDATRIVRAWAQYDALGQLASYNSAEERARVLLEATRGAEASIQDGALIGGLLRARIGKYFDGHVTRMVGRLSERPIGTRGRTLAHAFLFIAALHAIELRRMTPELLAAALSIDPGTIEQQVIIPLGEEAAAIRVGRLVLVRHRAIAESALRVAVEKHHLDLTEIYARLTRLGIRLAKQPGSGLDPKDFRFMSMKLGDQPRLALASARAARDEEPDDLRRVTNLFVVYAENKLEEDLVREAAAVADRARQMDNYRQAARHFYYQWSVATGRLGDHATACWLNALALADLPNVQALDERDIEVRVPGLGPAFRELSGKPDGRAFGRGLRALATVMREWPVNDRTKRDLRQYQIEADKLGVPPADFDTCKADLVAAIVAAWRSSPRSLPAALPDPPKLTYKQLFGLLATRQS